MTFLKSHLNTALGFATGRIKSVTFDSRAFLRDARLSIFFICHYVIIHTFLLVVRQTTQWLGPSGHLKHRTTTINHDVFIEK